MPRIQFQNEDFDETEETFIPIRRKKGKPDDYQYEDVASGKKKKNDFSKQREVKRNYESNED